MLNYCFLILYISILIIFLLWSIVIVSWCKDTYFFSIGKIFFVAHPALRVPLQRRGDAGEVIEIKPSENQQFV